MDKIQIQQLFFKFSKKPKRHKLLLSFYYQIPVTYLHKYENELYILPLTPWNTTLPI